MSERFGKIAGTLPTEVNDSDGRDNRKGHRDGRGILTVVCDGADNGTHDDKEEPAEEHGALPGEFVLRIDVVSGMRLFQPGSPAFVKMRHWATTYSM